MSFPQNLMTLHQQEEENRVESLKLIRADQNLSLHFDTLERAMNLIEHFARAWETSDPDDLALQLLGVRLFNASAAAIKLLLSGYHQAAGAQARDVLETSFLVDLLARDTAELAAWRLAPEEERKKRFQPVHVRIALDARDGNSSKRRAEHYARLSSYAAHPTPEGFRLLRPAANQPAFIGPFVNEESLRAVTGELAMAAVPAASNFRRHFTPRNNVLADYETLAYYLEGVGLWMERFFGRPFDAEQHRELAATIAKAKELAKGNLVQIR